MGRGYRGSAAIRLAVRAIGEANTPAHVFACISCGFDFFFRPFGADVAKPVKLAKLLQWLLGLGP